MKKVRGRGFLHEFDWSLYPNAEKFLQSQLANFLKNHKYTKNLSKKIENSTSTKIFDWIDHIVIPKNKVNEKLLKKLEFKQDKNTESPFKTNVFKHSRTTFFPILLTTKNITELALKPEELNNFKNKLKIKSKIQGKKYSPFRKLEIKKEKNYLLSAVERRGYNGFIIQKNPQDLKQYQQTLKILTNRKRNSNSDKGGMEQTLKLIKTLIKKLDKARTTDAFFRAERKYWQKRNKAGQIQKSRQDSLGLGWGNHDHHTYRSSRVNFTKLRKIFETLGLICRESFHAGKQAGWGAQIMEHPQCNIVTFSDLDLELEEKDTDFAHKPLKPHQDLSTVGLWVKLHGESVLQAGMHHLECRFNFNQLRKDLKKHKIKIMPPFSNFKFLKQAFTQGEIWKVNKKRLNKLLKNKSITKEQYKNFIKNGAIGSHMENLQRTQGFKGFNQDSVSAIIKATDPRKQKDRGA